MSKKQELIDYIESLTPAQIEKIIAVFPDPEKLAEVVREEGAAYELYARTGGVKKAASMGSV